MSFSKFLRGLLGQPRDTEIARNDPNMDAAPGNFAKVEHNVIPLELSSHPVVSLLTEKGLADLHDDANKVLISPDQKRALDFAIPEGTSEERIAVLEKSVLFAPQLLIPLELSEHPLILLLNQNGFCDLRSQENRLMLPIDKELAARMNCSRYAETPIASYINGVHGQLEKFWQSPERIAAENGDEAALEELMAQVQRFRQVLRAGIVAGQLYVAER